MFKMLPDYRPRAEGEAEYLHGSLRAGGYEVTPPSGKGRQASFTYCGSDSNWYRVTVEYVKDGAR